MMAAIGDRLFPCRRLAILLQLREPRHQFIHCFGNIRRGFLQRLMGVIQQAGRHDLGDADAYQRG